MIEADPLTMVTIANDASNLVLQAAPPVDLPGPVPDFVGEILDQVRDSAGEGGFGEAISDLTPGGGEAAEAGEGAASAGAENAGGN